MYKTLENFRNDGLLEKYYSKIEATVKKVEQGGGERRGGEKKGRERRERKGSK